MVKFLTTALGGLTALAVVGLGTPSGQAVLGIHRTQSAVPVSVISDPGPAKVDAPVAPPRVIHSAPSVARPVTRPVYRHTSVGPAAPAGLPAGLPMGGAGGLTNVLQNLPGMLQQGAPVPQYGPAAPAAPVIVPGGPGWDPGPRHGRWRHDGVYQGDNAPEPEHH
jgi:hypothetical protein